MAGRLVSCLTCGPKRIHAAPHATCLVYLHNINKRNKGSVKRLPSICISGRRQATCLVARAASSNGTGTSDTHVVESAPLGNVLVWYKNDLRVDDHPGLKLAASASSVTPVFCFDPTLYTQLLRVPNGVDGLQGAVLALQRRLRELGSDLLVLEGPAAVVLPALTQQMGVEEIVAEEEIEYRWLQTVADVSSALPGTSRLKLWKSSAYAREAYPENFRDFTRGRGSLQAPLEPPSSLPESLNPNASTSADGGDPGRAKVSNTEAWPEMIEAANREMMSPQVAEAATGYEESWGLGHTALLQRLASGGEAEALSTLRTYLGAGTGKSPSAMEIRDAIKKTENRTTPLGSFPAIFAQAITLGTLSRRRALWEAQQVLDKARWNPATLLNSQSILPAKSAAATAEAADFHWHLARSDRLRDTKTGSAPRHWRWRGFLTDYFAANPAEFGQAVNPEKPAFLLVHGFGAFGEQWRGQIRALAAAGYQVYAPTMPGYGRSEKPSVAYSQEFWVAFLRDFIVEVVRKPVVVAGNSIGGFLAAQLAADFKPLIQGLVLVNSAGPIRDGPPQVAAEIPVADDDAVIDPIGPPAIFADTLTKGIMFYLERSVASTLTRVYPTDPTNADAWLAGEIKRAAADPGAASVFRSVFYLPKPRALNSLVKESYGGPTLVLQGAKDPLNDAVGRANQLKALCPNVEVTFVDAGHCPFDESPHVVNEALLDFIGSAVKPSPAPPAELSAV